MYMCLESIERSSYNLYSSRGSTTCQSMPDRLLQSQSSGLVQPLAFNAVRRFLWTVLSLKVRQLFTEALSNSFMLILFLYPSHFPASHLSSIMISYQLSLTLSLPLFLSIALSTSSCPHPHFLFQPDEVRVQLGYKQPLQAIHSDLITQDCRGNCLNQFHNYPSLSSPSLFLDTSGSSKQLRGQLSKRDAS